MNNIPEVKLGIIAVSRDCFPIALSTRRRQNIVTACKTKGFEPYECSVTVENETDMLKAVEEVKAAGCNALAVFLGRPLWMALQHGPGRVVDAAAGALVSVVAGLLVFWLIAATVASMVVDVIGRAAPRSGPAPPRRHGRAGSRRAARRAGGGR